VSFLRCTWTLTGTAIGQPPHPGVDAQGGDDDEVQAEGVDDPGEGGADRVTEGPGAVDLAAGLVVQGVVADQFDDTGGGEPRDRVDGQQPPERPHVPPAVAHKAVVGVMGPAPGRVGHGDHRGDGAPPRRQHPAGEQVGEDREAGRGEYAAGHAQ
jgi:hypothetical protein